MKRRMLPGGEKEYESIPTDPDQRHEELVDLFGQYVFWLRNSTNEAAHQFVSSSEAREQLAPILRRPYDEIAGLELDHPEKDLKLAESSVDGFAELMLRILAHRRYDFLLGSHHAVRFRLELEIIDCQTDEIVHEETINRGGQKHFADYWGRWLNQHRDK